MTQCGKYSYALYMVHVPVASLLFPIAMRALGSLREHVGYEPVYLLAALICFAASWVLALASWFVVEKPILSLKRYFSYG